MTDVRHELVSANGLQIDDSIVVSNVGSTIDSASCVALISTINKRRGRRGQSIRWDTYEVQGLWHRKGREQCKRPREQPSEDACWACERAKQESALNAGEYGLSQLTIVTKKGIQKKSVKNEFQKRARW